MPGGVPARAIAERRLIERLMRARAFTTDSSEPLTDLRWVEDRGLKRLLHNGVIREHAPGRYYLDGAALADRYASRRLRLLIVVAVLVLLMTALTLLGGLSRVVS